MTLELNFAAKSLVLQDLRDHFPEIPEDRLWRILDEWDIHPHMKGNTLVGVGLTKGTEFHFLAAEGFQLDRKLMRQGLQVLLDRYGFLTTRVAHDDTANMRFNRLFGFRPTWADSQFQYFMLTEAPFGERKKKCQQ